MSNTLQPHADKFIVLKVGDRYLSKVTNKRISTAWHVLGAKKFFNTTCHEYKQICYYLISKKKRFSLVEFAPVCEKCKYEKKVEPQKTFAEIFAAEILADHPETMHPTVEDYLPY